MSHLKIHVLFFCVFVSVMISEIQGQGLRRKGPPVAGLPGRIPGGLGRYRGGMRGGLGAMRGGMRGGLGTMRGGMRGGLGATRGDMFGSPFFGRIGGRRRGGLRPLGSLRQRGRLSPMGPLRQQGRLSPMGPL